MSESHQSNRPLVIAAVMASMAMVALEATIVATAMPQIVTQLGGLHLYSWVFSSFLLTQTAMTVVFGKLSDLYGRKPVMLAGIAIFLVGSILAGFAWSMPAMIVFRLIQGVGAGAIQPVAMTIVADLYPARERGKVQGYLASVWAISAVLGPLVGSLIIHDMSWAWIFWLNVPIGLASAVGFTVFLRDSDRHGKPSLDIPGAVLFTAAIGALMLALTDAGASNMERALSELAVFVACTVLFVWQERRAADPMVSFSIWGHRPIAAANCATVFVGMAMMGLTTFLPVYVQGVLHRTPVVAGLALTMMMVGWPLGATMTAKSLHRFGLRQLMMFGSGIIPLGALFFVLLTPDSPAVLAGMGSLVMGLGMGIASISSLVLIQEIVEPVQRGSATASNLFSRNLGNTLGATLFGAVLNYGLAHTSGAVTITADQIKQLLDAQAAGGLQNTLVRLALHHSLHITFLVMFLIAVAILLAAMVVPPVSLRQAVQVSAHDGL
ncbi:MDR family MFS transporter [Herbaspirillum sp. RV1423]|uniref:MDR family MFS transporter n=1 Tax=Herbaspirillum sp. RV1423 TaxID=1443993 RepID=UPI0005590E2B|nr:MDR family MFS transporter [Herbaspirillum sp. RV1423]